MEVSRGGTPTAEQLGAGFATMDPYTAPLNNRGKDAVGAPVIRLRQSPTGRQPKTPKARVSVKDAAKPSRPIHADKPFPGFQDKVEAKRAALMAEVQKQTESTQAKPQQFLLDDDQGQEEELLNTAAAADSRDGDDHDMD